MRFRNKRYNVEAQRLIYPMTMETPRGKIKAGAGDYFCSDAQGEQFFVRAADFGKLFEPLPTEDERLLSVPPFALFAPQISRADDEE